MQSNPYLRRRDAAGLAIFGTLVAGAAVANARATAGAQQGWYRRLEKPPFQPPPAAFGPVWTVLYVLIGLSGWRVWRKPAGPRRSLAVELWGAQLALNGAFSELFFGQRRLRTSLAEVLALWGTVGAYTWAAHRVDRPAAWMMAPYLGWVGFASLLTADIVRRNR
jgi:translocator protein